ncbi:unnamed protein product [Orchesella dallaii]|uniref:Uncharacterized protein n=1 Tax=Orchesella dallaii TaxID=48710 RepID=A0ABP1QJF8_9HEXA
MGKNDQKKRKAPTSPSSSESSLMSIPPTSDQSSIADEVQLNRKAVENVNHYRNHMKQVTASRKRIQQPSTSKAGRSPSKTRESNRQKNGATSKSKAGKAQVVSTPDDSDRDDINDSSELNALDNLTKQELAAKYRKKYGKKVDVSAEVPRLKPKERDDDWKSKEFKMNRRDVMEKVRLEPELMRRPQPTKRPAPSTVPSEPDSNQSKKQKAPEPQNDSIIPLPDISDVLNESNSQDLEGPISSTPHPHRSNRNAASVPFSPVQNLNTNELQKYLIVTQKAKSGVSRRHRTLDDSSDGSVFAESQEKQADKSASHSILTASELSTHSNRKNATSGNDIDIQIPEELSLSAAVVNVPQPLTPSKRKEKAARSTREESHERPQEPSVSASSVNIPQPSTPSKRKANVTRTIRENSSERQQQIPSVSAPDVNVSQISSPSKRMRNEARNIHEQSPGKLTNVSPEKNSNSSTRRSKLSQPNRMDSIERHQEISAVIRSTENSSLSTASKHGSATINPNVTKSPKKSAASSSAINLAQNSVISTRRSSRTQSNAEKSPERQREKSVAGSSDVNKPTDLDLSKRDARSKHVNVVKSPEKQPDKSFISKSIAIILQPLTPSQTRANVTRKIPENSPERHQQIPSERTSDVNIPQSSTPSKRKRNETNAIRESPETQTSMAVLNSGPSTRRSKQSQPISKDSQERHSEPSSTRSAVNPVPNSTASKQGPIAINAIAAKSPQKALGGTSAVNPSLNSVISTRRSKRTQSTTEKSPERQHEKSVAGSSGVNKPSDAAFSKRGTRSKPVNAEKSPERQPEKSAVAVTKSTGVEPQPTIPSKTRANVARTVRENSSERQQQIPSVGTSGVNTPEISTPSKRKTNETHATRESPVTQADASFMAALNLGHSTRRSKPLQPNRKNPQEKLPEASTAVRSVATSFPNSTVPKQKSTTMNANAPKSPQKSSRVSAVHARKNLAVSPRRSKRVRSKAEKPSARQAETSQERQAVTSPERQAEASPEKQTEASPERQAEASPERQAEKSPERPAVKSPVRTSNVNKPSKSALSKQGLRSKHANAEKSPQRQPEVSSMDTRVNASQNYDRLKRRSKPTQQNTKESQETLENASQNSAASSRRSNMGDSGKGKLSSQASASSLSQSQSIRVKRQSIFETARNNKAKKLKTAPKQNVVRYVGNDIFGNYHMVKIEDFKIILERAQPNHKLNEEQTKNLCLRLNHWLEDLFVDLCENTEQPYGFITFQQMKEAAMNQALLPDNVSDEDLMLHMKRIFPRADWKRSESILFPSRYTQRKDTDDYYFRD